MVIMYKMTPAKKEKFIGKIDKMMDFLEEFRTCLDESDEYDEYEEPMYRGGNAMPRMRSRYSNRGM